MKLFILLLAGFSLFVSCNGSKKNAADTAFTALKTTTKNLEDKLNIIDTDPPQIDFEEADIKAVESAVVVLKKAIAKKGVSEKTKASANQAIEKANQVIDIANSAVESVHKAFVEYYRDTYIKDLEVLIANLEAKTEKVREAYLARATSINYTEGIIQETRASINVLKARVTNISKTTSQKGVSEDIKALVNQVVEKTNQAITKADQAIKDLLTLS